MELIQVIILGIVQGIAEFLPISSSAHLIIFRDIFGIGSFLIGEYEMSFDIALHFGTLLSILVFFFKDFLLMIKEGFTKGCKTTYGKLLWYVVVATIPAAIVGVLLEDKIDELVRSNYVLICIALSVMGIIIYLADKFSKQEKSFKEIRLRDAIIIGCSQVCALIPGFSRSGTTIAASRFLKINRRDAAKFSFYMSAPVVAGAVFIKILKGDMISSITYNPTAFIIGVAISFISGLLCIKFLLKYIKTHDYNIFMWYRLGISLLALMVLLFKS
ncbi:MAG: undecaprenyl-diphosphatase UppP [Bacilli bacterium]|nr:undecaprenyl-diphosphatase UppP [Bacilli bacterium]